MHLVLIVAAVGLVAVACGATTRVPQALSTEAATEEPTSAPALAAVTDATPTTAPTSTAVPTHTAAPKSEPTFPQAHVPSPTVAVKTANLAPDIALVTAEGEFLLSEQRGEVLLLYFSFPG